MRSELPIGVQSSLQKALAKSSGEGFGSPHFVLIGEYNGETFSLSEWH